MLVYVIEKREKQSLGVWIGTRVSVCGSASACPFPIRLGCNPYPVFRTRPSGQSAAASVGTYLPAQLTFTAGPADLARRRSGSPIDIRGSHPHVPFIVPPAPQLATFPLAFVPLSVCSPGPRLVIRTDAPRSEEMAGGKCDRTLSAEAKGRGRLAAVLHPFTAPPSTVILRRYCRYYPTTINTFLFAVTALQWQVRRRSSQAEQSPFPRRCLIPRLISFKFP